MVFETKKKLTLHMEYCESIFTKCRWYNLDGSRCTFRGQYMGNFCKRHCLGMYKYNPNGISSDGTKEGCGSILVRKIAVRSIQTIEEYSDHMFVGRGGIKYEYISSNVSYVKMRMVLTDEVVIFWRDSESRKGKPGHLVSTLATEPFDEYCEEIAVCVIGEEYYCEKCFEREYKGKIRSLRETEESV